jgi:hypothetical protein
MPSSSKTQDNSNRPPEDVVWEALTAEEKTLACTLVWKGNAPVIKQLRPTFVVSISRLNGLPANLVKTSPIQRRIRWVLKMAENPTLGRFRIELFRFWLFDQRTALYEKFLNGIGVTESAEPPDEISALPAVEVIETTLQSLLVHYSGRDVGMLIVWMIDFSSYAEFWQPLLNTDTGLRLYEALCGPVEWEEETEAERNVTDPNPTEGEATAADDSDADQEDGDEEEWPQFGPPASPPVVPPLEEEDFSTLDLRLISMTVATALEETGALSEPHLAGMIEEVIALNSSRHRSLFHRGFFHAMFDRTPKFRFAGENLQRSMWYLCGILLGLLRRNESAACVRLLMETEPELGKEMAASRQTLCGRKLLPLLCGPLLEAGHFPFVLSFVEKQFPFLEMVPAQDIAERLYQFASNRLRSGDPAGAERFVDLMSSFAKGETPSLLPPDFRQDYSARLDRRKAQCLQSRGDFPHARYLLNQLTKLENIDVPVGAYADLGLIEGGFRSLDAILPRAGKKQNKELLHTLKKGRQSFERAVAFDDLKATNAHLALGILLTLEESLSAQSRVDHLRKALGGMGHNPDAYAVGGIRDWAEFLLTIALLETAEPGNTVPAADLLPAIIRTKTLFPEYLWQRMLEAAAIFDDPELGIRIVEHMLEGRNEVEGLLANVSVFVDHKALMETVVERYLVMSISVRKRWKTLLLLLTEILKSRHPEIAGTVLDALEMMAHQEKEFRLTFSTMLENSDAYSPAWDAVDAIEARIGLLEVEGRLMEAAGLLRELFFRVKAERQMHHLVSARQIVERLRGLGKFEQEAAELESLLPEDDLPAALPEGLAGRVLYIGGDEVEAACGPRLLAGLQADYPSLQVELYHPGWTSNWHQHLSRLRPLIDSSDVVVISKYVRTQFGRHLRAYCGNSRPWWPCTGRGTDSLRRSILQAVQWRRERLN